MVGLRGVVAAAMVAIAALAGGCTAAAPGDGGAGTNPLATGKIDGLTENRFCGGPVSPDACQAPYGPASDRVTLIPHIAAVDPLIIHSDANGKFSAELLAGEWVFTAGVDSPGGSTDCPSVVVDVVAGATTPVTLRCTVELP